MRSKASTSYSVPIGGKLQYTGAWSWPTTGADYEQFHNIFEFARTSMASIERMRGELTAAGKLTSEGIADELQKAASEFYGKVRELKRNIIEARREQLGTERAALVGVQPCDSFDFAGAVADWEIAKWFSTLDTDRRNAVLATTLSGGQPEVSAALLRVPTVITGVTAQTRRSLQMSAVPAANREKVAAIDDAIDAAGAADFALREATKIVAQVSGYVESRTRTSPSSEPAETDAEQNSGSTT